jgi:hypothetical protein
MLLGSVLMKDKRFVNRLLINEAAAHHVGYRCNCQDSAGDAAWMGVILIRLIRRGSASRISIS